MRAFLKTFANTHKRGLLTLLKFLGVGVLIGTIVFASEGLGSWRAGKHQQKACNILYGIGNPLRDNSVYGEGLNTVTPEVSAKLDKAVVEAFAASDADPKHYRIFGGSVDLFALNLRGDGSQIAETLHSPYELYTYAIWPICTNFMYLGE